MTYFYEGDDKWMSWLEEMGVRDPPLSGNAALWPEHMKQDVDTAREEWSKSFHRTEDWDRIVKPLYKKWLTWYSRNQHGTDEESIKKLLEAFDP